MYRSDCPYVASCAVLRFPECCYCLILWMFLSNVDLSRFSECFSPPKQVLRIKQDQRGGRSGVSEEPPLPKYLSHFHPPDHFFWQLTKQTWSALTETLLIKTVLVLRMVVVLVFSNCDRDPQVSVRVQPGRQLHILLWVELFVHLRYSIMSKLSSFKTYLKLNLTYLDQKSSQSHHSPVAKRVWPL